MGAWPSLSNVIFALIFGAGVGYFTFNMRRLVALIKKGRPIGPLAHKKERWRNVLYIALGQSKLVKRPVSGLMHVLVYLGFVIINIEVLEIVIDGLFGTHRIFQFIGPAYGVLIGLFEVLAVLVFFAVVIFWLRRNALKLKRFWSPEMSGWPKKDANLILYFEMVLMGLFLMMNASDLSFQQLNQGNWISGSIYSMIQDWPQAQLHLIERICWWTHIVGILGFLNYLYFSKHLHILLAFPNVYYGRVTPAGQFENLDSVTEQVKLMMDPAADPYAAQPEGTVPEKFGASDVTDLTQVQLLNAMTCTECGRCTSECPANQTGKLLSPRKIMMDTRDRLMALPKEGESKQLLDDYISRDELWACTTCNACVEACPVSIDPVSIIMAMRQYLVMEQSAAPSELNVTMSNIENNAAPWPFNQQDRGNWINE